MIPRHYLTAGTAWLTRFIGVFCNFYLIRLVVGSLGEETYTGWILLLNFCGWIGLLDFGIGSALQYYVAQNRADPNAAQRIAAGVVALSAGIFILAVPLLYFLGPLFIKVLDPLHGVSDLQKYTALLVCAGLTLLTALGANAQKLLYGNGKGFWANLLSCGTQVAGVAGVGLVCFIKPANPLFWISVGYGLPAVALWWTLFIACSKVKGMADWRNLLEFKGFFGKSLGFWGFAVLSAFVLKVDYLILSQVSNTSEIFEYNIISRIYGLALFVYTAVLAAMQPELTAENKADKLAALFSALMKQTLLGVLLVVAVCGGLLLYPQYILALIAPGHPGSMSIALTLLVGMYHVLRVWTDTYAMVLLAKGNLKYLWMWVPVQAIIGVALQLTLGRQYGAAGVVIGLIGSYLLTVAVFLPIHARSSLLKSCS